MLLKIKNSLIFFLAIFLANEIKTLGLSNSFKIIPDQEQFEFTSNGFVSKKVPTLMSSEKQKPTKSQHDMNINDKNTSQDVKNFPMNKNLRRMNYRKLNLTPLNKQITGLVKVRNNELVQIPAIIMKRSSILKNEVKVIKSYKNENNVKDETYGISKDFVNNKAQNNQESKDMKYSYKSSFVGSSRN